MKLPSGAEDIFFESGFYSEKFDVSVYSVVNINSVSFVVSPSPPALSHSLRPLRQHMTATVFKEMRKETVQF